jgi:hypothetical protein
MVNSHLVVVKGASLEVSQGGLEWERQKGLVESAFIVL